VAVLVLLAVAAAGYLLGSVPTGFLIGKARGVDLRTLGSGNIGATNALRVLGKPAGVLVFVIDAFKGVAACWAVPRLAEHLAPGLAGELERNAILAGLAAIVGHNYTCWLRFKGGKGIATSAGALGVLMPTALLLTLGLWLVVFALSRYVSLASITAAFGLPWIVWATQGSPTLIIAAVALSLLALWKHKGNIQRLLHGTEHRFTRS
jgi:glycerol-3-phosphate acyltransferase PlsY